MKKNVLVLSILGILTSISICSATESVSMTQTLFNGLKNDFIPAIKNQLFPMIFDFLQVLITTLVLAILAYVTNYLKSLSDVKVIDDELDKGFELMKTLINDNLNSAKYKELKKQYTEGKISTEEFYRQCYFAFKQPTLEAVSNKASSLGKSILELANVKFGDGQKYLSGKLEEFLNEIKKK